MKLDSNLRSLEYKRDNRVEEVIMEVASLLGDTPIQQEFANDNPIVFIVGCARSGTTLLTQILAAKTEFCYPTNFISRFYYNPYVGALLQYLMFDLDTKNELFGNVTRRDITYRSNLGKTIGALSPNEFWYYWRKYFQFGDIQKIEDNDIRTIDWHGFLNGIRAIQHVYNKPIFMKAMIMNWHIQLLWENVPNCYFVFIKRDLAHNAYSLIQTRKKYFNNIDEWYSFKPEEYDHIMSKSPYHQVVEQVLCTNNAVKNGLVKISNNRSLSISYEDLCNDPGKFLDDIYNMLAIQSTRTMDVIKLPMKSMNDTKDYNKEEWQTISEYAMIFK